MAVSTLGVLLLATTGILPASASDAPVQMNIPAATFLVGPTGPAKASSLIALNVCEYADADLIATIVGALPGDTVVTVVATLTELVDETVITTVQSQDVNLPGTMQSGARPAFVPIELPAMSQGWIGVVDIVLQSQGQEAKATTAIVDSCYLTMTMIEELADTVSQLPGEYAELVLETVDHLDETVFDTVDSIPLSDLGLACMYLVNTEPLVPNPVSLNTFYLGDECLVRDQMAPIAPATEQAANLACSAVCPVNPPNPDPPAPTAEQLETADCVTRTTEATPQSDLDVAGGRWSVHAVPPGANVLGPTTSPGLLKAYAVLGMINADVPDNGEISQEVCYSPGEVKYDTPPTTEGEAAEYLRDLKQCYVTGAIVGIIAVGVAAAGSGGMAAVGVALIAAAATIALCANMYDPDDYDLDGYAKCSVVSPGVIWGGQDYTSTPKTAALAGVSLVQTGSSSSSATNARYFYPKEVDTDKGVYNGVGTLSIESTTLVYDNENFKTGESACDSVLLDLRNAAYDQFQNFGNVEGDGEATISMVLSAASVTGPLLGRVHAIDGPLGYAPGKGLVITCPGGVGSCPTSIGLVLTQCGVVRTTAENPGEVTFTFNGGSAGITTVLTGPRSMLSTTTDAANNSGCTVSASVYANGQCVAGCNGGVGVPLALTGQWEGGGDSGKFQTVNEVLRPTQA